MGLGDRTMGKTPWHSGRCADAESRHRSKVTEKRQQLHILTWSSSDLKKKINLTNKMDAWICVHINILSNKNACFNPANPYTRKLRKPGGANPHISTYPHHVFEHHLPICLSHVRYSVLKLPGKEFTNIPNHPNISHNLDDIFIHI